MLEPGLRRSVQRPKEKGAERTDDGRHRYDDGKPSEQGQGLEKSIVEQARRHDSSAQGEPSAGVAFPERSAGHDSSPVEKQLSRSHQPFRRRFDPEDQADSIAWKIGSDWPRFSSAPETQNRYAPNACQYRESPGEGAGLQPAGPHRGWITPPSRRAYLRARLPRPCAASGSPRSCGPRPGNHRARLRACSRPHGRARSRACRCPRR